MQCGVGTSYKPSMSTCPHKSCESLNIRNPTNPTCLSEPLVEGCAPEKCSNGNVYESESSYKCVRSIDCKAKCLKFGNIQYYDGDIMEEGLDYTW